MALNIQNALHGTDEMEDEVNRTIESLDYTNKRMKRKSYRRYSRAIRTQAEEDEERQKILMEALHGGNTKKAAQTDKDNEMRKAEAIKIALAKAKQLAARAFKEDIIDQLSTAVEQQPIFHAGTMLDASARVYSFRVDVTHSEACDVRMKLGDPTTSNKVNEGGKHQADGKHGHGSEGSDMDTDIDASSDDGPTTQKQATDKEDRKKRGLKDGANRLEEDSDIEADEEHTPANLDDLEDFDDLEATEESDPENEDILMEPEQLMEKFRKKADSTHAKCMKRRNKVSMVTTDTNELDDREETAQMCAHLYSKATHNFDEGSTSGLLMQNITIGKHGRRLLLHNDVKCPPDPPNEKVNADDLLPFYGLMNDIEKAEPPPSATIFGDDDASTSLMVDPTTQYDETQAFLGADGNATFAVEPSLTVPAHCALLKTIKESMKKNVPRSPKDFLFFNRLRLQRKLGITSGKFMKILSSVKEVEPSLYSSLVHAMFTIPQRSKIHADSSRRSIDSQNWIGNAVIADELELFEQSYDWVVNRMKWEKMEDVQRAEMLKSLADEDQEYNYFFARSGEPAFQTEDNNDPEEDAYIWCSEGDISNGDYKVTEQDYKILAHMLAQFKVVKGGSLFTRKGDALNRTLAAIPILTPARKRIGAFAGRNAEFEMTTMPLACARRLDMDEMAAAEELPGIGVSAQESGGDLGGDDGLNDDFLNEADEDMADGTANKSAIGGDDQANAVIAEDDATAGPELLATDGVNPSTAVGDLHFLDENAILQTVSSLIADEAHWKKAKSKLETTNVTQKQLDGEGKKRERVKVKKEQDLKRVFEWSDEDDLPLSKLRDRISVAKRANVLCRSEDDILSASTARKIHLRLYMPHYFCKLSHVFVGEWGKLRINRASSEPLERTSHEDRWIDSVVRDMQTNEEPSAGKSFMEFLTLFNGYFNDADEHKVRAGSEPFTYGSSGDLFDDNGDDGHTPPDDDANNNDPMNSSKSAPCSSKHNRSFFSDADSDVEDAEMFGVKYSIRQRRINAPAVKRAIGTVLGEKALDADALNAQLQLARRLNIDEVRRLGDQNVSIMSEDGGELDLSLVDSRGKFDISAEEHELQIREEEEMGEDPTCDIHKGDVKVSNVQLNGRHTFSSLLVRIPDYLTGRTANDLNPINAFSVLLHMCNENNLELIQRRDERNMVLPSAMGDFTIMPSRRNKRKHP